SEVKRCTETTEKTNRELSDARAASSGALSASLISRLENVVGGDRPIGPGFLVVTFGGLMAGLATGIGLVFLMAPMGQVGRRLTDLLPFGGRRASDRAGEARRNADPAARGSRRSSDAVPENTRRATGPAPQAVPSSPVRGRRM